MNGLMAADEEARRRIREDINTNFFVEAGAGSGKTTALVERMVAMVTGGIEVETICAITFTVAASREFFNRFQQRLSKIRWDPETEDVVRERVQKAIRNIDLCFMGTIDSFCNQVLGEHPNRAGVPCTVKQIEEDEKPGLYRREYAKLKRGEYGTEMSKLYREFCDVHDKPDKAFLECIPMFMKAHASHWVIPERPEEDWRVLFSPELDQLLTVLETIESRKENLYEKHADSRKARDYLPEAIRVLRDYRSGSSFSDVLYALGEISVSDDEKKRDGLVLICEPGSIGIETEFSFAMRGTRPAVYCLTLSGKGGLLSRMKEYRYAFSVRFLAPFAVGMAEQLKKNGELSFYDHLLYLRDMLRRDAATGGSLIRHIRSRYSRFLIDEFQDTDPLQTEVFFRLASETPTEDWRDSRPVPGSLFIVGDPKQSIYRFRGADVAFYLEVKRLFASPVGEVLSLQQNFRSSSALRRWYNEVFDTLLPEETVYQSKFEPIPIEEGADEEGVLTGAWTYRTTKGGNAGDVAAIIRRLVDSPDILIHTREDRKNGLPPRRLRYGDVMVITRTKAPLVSCQSAMKYFGIPCRVDGKTSFSSCPAFVAMADLLSAFSNPSNSSAVYRVLRGDIFRFSREAITEWVLRGNKLYLYGHENDENEISSALARLNKYRNQNVMLSPAALCRAVLEEFDVFQSCGTEDMEYVWYAIELLRNGTDKRGSKSLTDAAAFLNDLAEDKKDTGKALNLTGEPDRVYLANLHKVKGLEAPVVILAQTEFTKPSPKVYMEMDGMNQKRWAFELSDDGIATRIHAETERFGDEQSKEAASLLAEETRLLYVAATRAGCALLIPDAGKECLWDSLRQAETNDLETILPRLSGEVVSPAEFGYEQQPEERRELIDKKLLHNEAGVKSWDIITPSDSRDSNSESDTVQNPDSDTGIPHGETSSLLLGTVIHRAMEMLVSSRAMLSDEAIVAAIREENNIEEDDENTVPYIRTVLSTVRDGGWKQESGIPADILSELLSADEVYCEVPFCVSVGSSLTNGVMDAVYRKGDAWHVVDYKTNADPYGLDVVYQDQLAAYRKAAQKLFGSVAGVHTYHIPLLK